MPVLTLHGSPSVTLADRRTLALSAREAALLAWLHLEGPTPRALLAGRLWPGGDDAKARTNLRQTLARLRRAAGALLAEDDGVLRLAAGVTVAGGGGARLLGPLEFDDAPELAAWLDARRDADRRDHLRDGLAAAREHLGAGRLDAALAAADALLATDPAVEEAHRVRMEAFYLRDDRAAAVAAWDACRDALRNAFGIAPSAATNELGRLILARDATPAPGRARTLPAALRRPPHLVGRAAVLADLRRALELGRSVVVAGVGGIGKSRLLAEVAATSAAALSVGARPGDDLLPAALLTRLLTSALERFPPPADAAWRDDLGRWLPAGPAAAPVLHSALDQRRLFATVSDCFAACHAQGLRLVVVDDLQFADELSLGALRTLFGGWLAAPAGGACSALVGARPEALPAAAAALLAMFDASGRAARFDLAPLHRDAVRALLDDLPLAGVDRDALAAALMAQVGGHPAFLLESLKSLWLDGFDGWQPGQPLPVPATLVDAVRQRLQRLPADALQLAQLAAVARNDFSLALAGAALGRSLLQLAPVLAALEGAQVFDGPGFGHDLVAEAVLRSVPAALVSPLHRLVAEHLAAHGGAAAAIAHHLVAAGDARAAAPWQMKAARQARAHWQMAEAAGLFEAAARGFGTDDEPARLEAWLGATRCTLWARRLEDAQSMLAQAKALLRTPVDRARWRAQRITCDFNARRIGDAVRGAQVLLEEFDTLAERLDPATLVDGLRTITSCVPYGAAIEAALALARRLQARFDALADADDDAQLSLRIAHGGLLHWDSRPREALAELDAAWQRTREARDAGTRLLLANQRMRVRHALGDLAGAIETGEALLREAEPLEPGVIFIADAMHVVAMMEVAAGRAAAGLERFDRLLDRVQRAGETPPDLFLTSQALAFMACGRLDDARAVLSRHPPAGRDGMGLQDLGYHLTRARLALLSGEPAAPWLDLAAAAAALPPGLVLQRDVVLASMRAPRPGEHAARAALADRLRARGMRGLLRVAEVAAARAALVDRDPSAAAAHARRALALAGQVDGWVDEPASVWLAAAEVLAACGHADDAAAAASQGAAWVAAGAAQWAHPSHRSAWLDGHPVHRALRLADGAQRRTG